MKIDHFKERESVHNLINKLVEAEAAVQESTYYLDEEDFNMFEDTKKKLNKMIDELSEAVYRFDMKMFDNPGYFNI